MPTMNATRRNCRSGFALWLWLAASLVFAFAPRAVAAEGLVFQATRSGAAPIFLVGTMHSDDPRVMAVLPRVVGLIDLVDTVALEVVQDPAGMARAAAATLLPAGQNLFELTDPALRAAVERVAGLRAVPLPVLARLKPWAAALVLGMPEVSGGHFLDTAIQRQAGERGRRLVGLEDAAEQLAVFDAMEGPLQLALLDAAVKNPDELTTQLEELTLAYLSGDLGQLEQSAVSRFGEMDPAVETWFRDRLIDRRNRRMAQRVLELAGQGALLVAVGALHLPGESGLLAALERSGYRVEPRPD
jgi:uncharacterized protein YbaP (TraB family)